MSVTPYTKDKFALAPEGAKSYRRYQRGVKTTKGDRSRPQVYLLNEGRVTQWRTWSAGGNVYNPLDPTNRGSAHNFIMPFSGSKMQSGRNAAYEKLVEQVTGEQAAIGTALAEARESYGMIANRANGLYRAMKKLRKGNFRGFLKELSVSPKRKHRSKTRAAAHEVSGLWLEYWFGWSPSVSDIYTAAMQLSEPYPSGKFKGTAKRIVYEKPYGNTFVGVWVCKTAATFRLVNPDAYLASQMGLTNPATVIWEIIPFSFLVDWCFDVSSYINSFSDFVGIEISDAYTTEMLRGEWIVSSTSSAHRGEYKAKQVFMERRSGLVRPLPNSEILSNLGVSRTRAASAMALLTQILRV